MPAGRLTDVGIDSRSGGRNRIGQPGLCSGVMSTEDAVECHEPEREPTSPDRARGFESVYAEQWAPLVRLGRLLTGSGALGEELAQEAFIGLLNHGERVEYPAAYLRRSLTNAAMRSRRRAVREREYLAAHPPPTSELPAEVDETFARLAALPDRQRAVLVLRYYEDLSEAAIAEILGCRPGTVKSLAARGLDRLRKELL
jgi:RNA polymerase sigma factor (sigma-70 family)